MLLVGQVRSGQVRFGSGGVGPNFNRDRDGRTTDR